MGHHNYHQPQAPGFLGVAAGVEHDIQKLYWKTDSPVWVDQWPLRKDELNALQALVEEQLVKGNIKPTNNPWNSPVFVIKKPG